MVCRARFVRRSSFAIAFILLSSLSAIASSYYVSPAGDDSAAGDAAQPFLTISHAAEVGGAGDRVVIEPGVYRESVGLTKSGTREKPIVFAAAKAGTAIITGADPLSLWSAVTDHPGQYITDWPHDFIIDHKADGSPVRDHGAPPPVGCAEQILWEGHPLRQVMSADDLQPGCFWVDWDFHTLTVWLPGGIDARNANIEGCVRPYLVSPLEKDNVFADARYITLRGLVMRNAANFAQRGGCILGSGWRAERCAVEGDSAGGISLDGDDIVVDHCVAQFNGFCGISGSGNNNTLEDCIVRQNNRKGFPPDWEGGGGKFTNTTGLRVIRHLSCENVGPGLWLDIDNRNYSIVDSIFYGNRGLTADWQGSGICLEIDPGPGVVKNNLIYSNTGAGVMLAESANVVVSGNALVDNTKGIELRAMTGREGHELQSLEITRNRFKEWRQAAIETTLGDWANDSAARRGLTIDHNIYDAPRGRPFFNWAGSPLGSLDEVRQKLGIESSGSAEAIDFIRALENVPTIGDSSRPTIARAMASAAAGAVIDLPATCRSPILNDSRCAVFDWDDHCVLVALPTPALKTRMQNALGVEPVALPVMARVRIDQILPHEDVRATLVEIR
jgi:parallel beta-helix repeat protein